VSFYPHGLVFSRGYRLFYSFFYWHRQPAHPSARCAATSFVEPTLAIALSTRRIRHPKPGLLGRWASKHPTHPHPTRLGITTWVLCSSSGHVLHGL